jgi:hypothetical protein
MKIPKLYCTPSGNVSMRKKHGIKVSKEEAEDVEVQLQFKSLVRACTKLTVSFNWNRTQNSPF